MQRFTIRQAEQEDAGGILACLSASFAEFEKQYSAVGFADTVMTPDTIGARLQAMSVLVAEDSGKIVGTIGFRIDGETVAHIRGMAVLPEFRGRGIAQALMDRTEQEIVQAGCSSIVLDTTRPLERAIAFYERNGFKPTGLIADFFGMELLEYRKEL